MIPETMMDMEMPACRRHGTAIPAPFSTKASRGGGRTNTMSPPGACRFLVTSCSGGWNIAGAAFDWKRPMTETKEK
jgi:hypothetical protein